MTKEVFNTIIDQEIMPFICQIQENNSRIKIKDIEQCKNEIFNEYNKLRIHFKNKIFGKKVDDNLLDRHKIASCICCAFLKVSVFNKSELIDYIKETKQPIEMYFYYVNEMVAFYAGCKFLSFFMTSESMNEQEKARQIIEKFPLLPPVKTSTMTCYDNIIFNLSQIKTDMIGLEHFDLYNYSMFFFMLESYFYTQAA